MDTGSYRAASFTLSAFDVALPPGTEPVWQGGTA
jgi:hypothetical protein